MMYSMSKQITWYEELSWIGEYRFPLQRRKQSYTALMTEWVHDYCTHIDACKSLDDETKRRIKTFANSLVECHTRYLNSQFADAYTLFNQSMNDVCYPPNAYGVAKKQLNIHRGTLLFRFQ